MGRDEVARNQRARIYGGMIESVSQRGYHATTVAHVIALAGVSRRAFYEQFSNKEQCFLATYDIVVARARKRVLDAWLGERGWANRLHASCKALLDEAAETPKGPRLVLVDSLGIGPRARERMQLAGFAFERLVASAFQVAPDGTGFPRLTCRGIVGGVRHVVFVRMLQERERELYTLTDEVLDWIEAYRSPAAARLGVFGPSRTPRVPPTPAAFLTRDDRRARVLGSVVHLTLDEGYSRLTDPQIAQFAGMSTEAFHKQFANKEECFLAVLDEFVHEALASVEGSFEKAATWPEGVYRAITAFVRLPRRPPGAAADRVHRPVRGRPRHGRADDALGRGVHQTAHRERPRTAARAGGHARRGHRRAVGDHLRVRRQRPHRQAAVPGRSPRLHSARALHRAQARGRRDPGRAQTAAPRLSRL